MPKKTIKTFATPEQIASVKGDIEEMTRMLNSSDENKSNVGFLQHSSKYIDPEEVQRNIVKNKKLLREMVPKKLAGKAANKALKEAHEIKVWIKENIPKETYALFPRSKDPVGKAPDFARQVDRQFEWMNSGNKMINRYNYLMQRIDPSLPREGFEKHIHERA